MIKTVIYMSFVTASISFTVTETQLFKPIREWVKNRSAFFGKMLNCGYCFGHWVSFGLVAVYKPKLFVSWRLLDYFLTALVVAWFGAFQVVLMRLLMGKASE